MGNPSLKLTSKVITIITGSKTINTPKEIKKSKTLFILAP
jgi:hypothetical protein